MLMKINMMLMKINMMLMPNQHDSRPFQATPVDSNGNQHDVDAKST